MNTAGENYKKAFEAYLRWGTPIDLSIKQLHSTTHYIWRTRGDGKVRSSHADNNGKIFSWENPPPTGHPGEDYGCRCTAEPYVPAVSESFDITFNNISDTGARWSSLDFVNHYFFGNGQTVTVRQTGHLRAIVQEYRHIVIDDPTRLPAQIADEARKNIDRSFSDDFRATYNMQSVVFSIGDTTIEGDFRGTSKEANGILHISGSIEFRLRDKFRDPLNIEKLLGERYAKIDEEITTAISEVLAEMGSTLARVGDMAVEVTDRVTTTFGNVDRQLRDYIYNRALNQLRRRKSAILELNRKDLRELPGSTIYDIVDDWGATFTAKVFNDKSKSHFTK